MFSMQISQTIVNRSLTFGIYDTAYEYFLDPQKPNKLVSLILAQSAVLITQLFMMPFENISQELKQELLNYEKILKTDSNAIFSYSDLRGPLK